MYTLSDRIVNGCRQPSKTMVDQGMNAL